jgi:hypothetical protein
MWTPLVKEKTTLFESTKKFSFQNPFSPFVIFSFVLGLALLFSLPLLHKSLYARLFDVTLFLTTGAVGLLILFLWFFTTHHSQVNLNIFWANPLNLLGTVLLLSKKRPLLLLNFCLGYGLVLALILAFWSSLPQQLNPAYLPICIALCVRCCSNYWFLRASYNRVTKKEKNAAH